MAAARSPSRRCFGDRVLNQGPFRTRYKSGLFILRNSSRGALISQLQNVDALGLGGDYLKTYVAKVNAVTPPDVQKMTSQYLKPQSMTIVVVGDKSKITDELAPYENGKPL